MQQFFLALQFLTRLPTPQVTAFRQEDLAHAAVWFPGVGVVVGAVVAFGWWLGGLVHPLLAGLLGLVAWVWVTGALHLDGLSDLADALGAAHRDQARFLDVLQDPHVGSFGVVALVLQLLAKLVLLALLAQAALPIWALLLIPAWARLGALGWSQSLPPLKPGLGERFAWRTPSLVPVIWLFVLLPAAIVLPMLLVAPLLLAAWWLYLRVRLGGMTGDCLGAGVEIVESLLLLALLAGQTWGVS